MWPLQNRSKTRHREHPFRGISLCVVVIILQQYSSDHRIWLPGTCACGFRRCSVFPELVGIVPPTVLLHATPGFTPNAIDCAVLSRFGFVFEFAFAFLAFAFLLVSTILAFALLPLAFLVSFAFQASTGPLAQLLSCQRLLVLDSGRRARS